MVIFFSATVLTNTQPPNSLRFKARRLPRPRGALGQSRRCWLSATRFLISIVRPSVFWLHQKSAFTLILSDLRSSALIRVSASQISYVNADLSAPWLGCLTGTVGPG